MRSVSDSCLSIGSNCSIELANFATISSGVIVFVDGVFSSYSGSSAVFGALKNNKIATYIEEHHRCFRLGIYFMAAALDAASYSRGGFIPCLAGSARRVMVPGGSTFHLEPGTILSFPY